MDIREWERGGGGEGNKIEYVLVYFLTFEN